MITKRLILLISLIGLFACEMPPMPDWASKSNLPSLPFFIEEGPKATDDKNCQPVTNLNLQDLNWEEAKKIKIFSRKSGIVPKILLLKVNTPNIIRFYNGTNVIWNFYSEKFFKQSVVVKIIYGGKNVTIDCIESIRIGKLKWAEVHIVPLQKGKFDFQNKKSFSFNSLFSSKNVQNIGQITVR